MPKTIKVITAGHCGYCQEFKKLLQEGRVEVNIPDAILDVIDIETPQGFPELINNNLTSVPVALHEGQMCELLMDKERGVAVIKCGASSGSPERTK